jgi:endonuclease/exonuclease/phosphatase family metal-dependent hydrolase
MSYNLLNFMDVFDDPYSRDEDTRVKPRREILLLAQAIKTANPDLIAVQEIEAEGLLRAFVNDHLGDQGYRQVLVMPTNSDRGGNLGFISRLPIERVSSHRWTDLSLPGDPQSWRFARDVMQVRIRATPKLAIEFFVVHLKSKIDSPNDKNSTRWRLSEARGLRSLLDERLAAEPDALLCVLGDHNDEPDSLTIRTLTQPSANGRVGLADLHSHLAQGKRLTHRSEKYGDSTLDYIFASPALAKRSLRDGARVLEDKELIVGSDHAPILAEFTLE